MAFHPYPQVIRWLFNANRCGPPSGVTRTSPCPWIDHPVSRLMLPTISPCSDSLSLRLPPSKELTSPATLTRRIIMQKARRHRCNASAPSACKHTVSGSVSIPCSGCFSPFPHGTSPLSVSREYLALAGGPAGFPQDSSCPAVLRYQPGYLGITCTGLSPSMEWLSNQLPLLPQYPNGLTLQPPYGRNHTGLGYSPFARRYLGNHCCFLLLRVLRCVSSPG